MKIVDIDGKLHVARSVKLEHSNEDIDRADFNWVHPVRLDLEIRTPVNVGYSIDTIHISSESQVMSLSGIWLSNLTRTIDERYAYLKIMARSVSVREK